MQRRKQISTWCAALMLSLLWFLQEATTAYAQWEIQKANTTASLRGVHYVGNGIAWASGTQGTILRTIDEGKTWHTCTIPPNAEQLDFRGIQAFDESTAVAMSSGKGDLSRVYKTTDACRTWRLVFTNPDKEGFWDVIQFSQKGFSSHGKDFGVLLGDPVDKHFVMFLTYDSGEHWESQIQDSPQIESKGEAVFAASNSSLLVTGMGNRAFVTGGLGGPRLIGFWVGEDDTDLPDPIKRMKGAKPVHFLHKEWYANILPMSRSSESAGAFSYAKQDWHEVIVGGDYQKPNDAFENGWYIDRSRPAYKTNWTLAKTPPHGYRSSVAYEPATKTWITVGPNGTDISTNDGRNWQALAPTPFEPADADKRWNALSLPFVVGPGGRIGKLRSGALKAMPKP